MTNNLYNNYLIFYSLVHEGNLHHRSPFRIVLIHSFQGIFNAYLILTWISLYIFFSIILFLQMPFMRIDHVLVTLARYASRICLSNALVSLHVALLFGNVPVEWIPLYLLKTTVMHFKTCWFFLWIKQNLVNEVTTQGYSVLVGIISIFRKNSVRWLLIRVRYLNEWTLNMFVTYTYKKYETSENDS